MIVSGSGDHLVKILNAISGKQIRNLSTHKGDVTSIAIIKNSKYIVTSSYDKTIKIWRLISG